MDIHVYPVMLLSDLLTRIYGDTERFDAGEDEGRKGLLSRLFPKKAKYRPKLPSTLEELNLEHESPYKKLGLDWFRYTQEKYPHEFDSSDSRWMYARHLNDLLMKESKYFEGEKRIAADFSKSFTRHEQTKIVNCIDEELFIPELTGRYLGMTWHNERANDIMYTTLLDDEGRLLGWSLNTMLPETHNERGKSQRISLGVAARPMVTYLRCEVIDGERRPLSFAGQKFGNNIVITYGIVDKKSMLSHTDLWPLESLKDSVSYGVEINYPTLLKELTHTGLHEWYHWLGVEHDTERKCVMNPSVSPLDELTLDLCQSCEHQAVANAWKISNKTKDKNVPV
jgi:hypothetical protein